MSIYGKVQVIEHAAKFKALNLTIFRLVCIALSERKVSLPLSRAARIELNFTTFFLCIFYMFEEKRAPVKCFPSFSHYSVAPFS